VSKLKMLVLAIACAAAGSAVAEGDPFAESDILLCAVASASVCESSGRCRATTPEAVSFARFARVNLKDREMRSVWPAELDRATLIEQLVESEGLIVMQGIDDDIAWTFTIEKPSGDFVAAASGVGAVYVLSGTCMPQLPQ
jgi:hypothetical protein